MYARMHARTCGMYGWMQVCMHACMHVRIKHAWMDGRMDTWMNGYVHNCAYVCDTVWSFRKVSREPRECGGCEDGWEEEAKQSGCGQCTWTADSR